MFSSITHSCIEQLIFAVALGIIFPFFHVAYLAWRRNSFQQHWRINAIGEACRFLLRVHQHVPLNHPRQAMLYYDSTYAYGAVTRLTKVKDNVDLVETVACLVEAVRGVFQLRFQHVRAHTDIYGNEAVDRLAGRGATGCISLHAFVWTERFEGPLGTDPPPPAPRRPPRMRRPAAVLGWVGTLCLFVICVRNPFVPVIYRNIDQTVVALTQQIASVSIATNHPMNPSKHERTTNAIHTDKKRCGLG